MTFVTYNFGHRLGSEVRSIIASDCVPKPDANNLLAWVYDPMAQHGMVAISAEHSIGREKAEHLWRGRSVVETSAMNLTTHAIDTGRLLNPRVQFYHSDATNTIKPTRTKEVVHG